MVAAIVLAAALSATPLCAQQPQPNGPPNALQGFSQNRDKPIKINSATLEVRDKDKVATFAGDVHLVQGDTTMRSKTLVVFYDDDASAPKPVKPAAGTQQNQQIKRVEAKGNVIVVQKDQTATGENGIFDMRANTVTLVGNVVISQGQNTVQGDRLTVDMTTGVSRVECTKPGAAGPGHALAPCRVSALLNPGAMKPQDGHGADGSPTGAAGGHATPAPPARRTSQPLGLTTLGAGRD